MFFPNLFVGKIIGELGVRFSQGMFESVKFVMVFLTLATNVTG
ncbi:hypothetical protein N480_11150 [Pseudoalteromonas luteoviolacea S2607]|uniref:Uncharacterized protein n=1 Tax=Pseudoalteromonas luteoviolacea S4060-1 TaxID=1365257 RepID=A0A167N705_9GAMM|nr:hypothetical protein N480_11150 [Pseudoalteromonas luteoviolacea S2607]KZN67601.1 hypothetical protein N478_02260 [Pseudoalteromonas luteoviolacea S4060-1]